MNLNVDWYHYIISVTTQCVKKYSNKQINKKYLNTQPKICFKPPNY